MMTPAQKGTSHFYSRRPQVFFLQCAGERERERMALSVVGALWKVFKSGLLATNAVTILHRQRFLRKCERGKCVESNTQVIHT